MEVEDPNIIMSALGNFLFCADQLIRMRPTTYLGIKCDCFPNVTFP